MAYPFSDLKYSNGLAVFGISFCTAIVCAAISWVLIYRTNSYKNLRSSIDKASKKLETMKTDRNKTNIKKSKTKKIDCVKTSLKELSHDLSLFKFKSWGVAALVLFVVFGVVYGLLNSLSEDKVVSKLPFKPVALIWYLPPYAQQLLDSHSYLDKVVIPVGGTSTAILIAWFLMPRILRKFHTYVQGPVSLLPASMSGNSVPYEQSFWGALEDPVRYLVTFMAFSQIGVTVAPTTITSEYLAPVWRGAVIVSFVWFLHRWKANVFARILPRHSELGLDREKVLSLDKISSIGLFVIGIMAFAEACGVAVQSIVTVGVIGGVATAFAAKDILGDVSSGLSMQFSKPFSVGDTIKAGSIEGKVVKLGLTTTYLLSPERFHIIVPNSFFSSQVIVNKSRGEYRAIISKILLQTEDLSKIPQISDDVKEMLRTNDKVFLEEEVPYCFLSRIQSSYAELTLGYNVKYTSEDKLYSVEQEILLETVQIFRKHGVALGSTCLSKKPILAKAGAAEAEEAAEAEGDAAEAEEAAEAKGDAAEAEEAAEA